MCSLRSLQYNMETKHEIHDEGGETESTMEMMCVRLNCETQRQLEGERYRARLSRRGMKLRRCEEQELT
jgi:hypothetical protein